MNVPAILWGTLGPDSSQIDTGLEMAVNKKQSLVHVSQSWAYGHKADGSLNYAGFNQRAKPMLQRAWDRQQICILDLQGWDLQNQRDLAFNNASVISGAHDAFLHQWFREAAAWAHPFFLLAEVEANGDWYVYSDKTPWANNAPGSFVQRWRHIHDIAVAESATNVTWVLGANICSPTGTRWATAQPLSNIDPGADYFDWWGIDAFDFAGGSYKTTHITLAEAIRGKPGWYRDCYAEMQSLHPEKPIMASSFAFADETLPTDLRNRPAMIAALFADQQTRYPAVRALSYFNWNSGDGGTWALSGDSLAAFAAGIQSPAYLPVGAWTPEDKKPIVVPPLTATVLPDLPADYQKAGFKSWDQVADDLRKQADISTGLAQSLKESLDSMTVRAAKAETEAAAANWDLTAAKTSLQTLIRLGGQTA